MSLVTVTVTLTDAQAELVLRALDAYEDELHVRRRQVLRAGGMLLSTPQSDLARIPSTITLVSDCRLAERQRRLKERKAHQQSPEGQAADEALRVAAAERRRELDETAIGFTIPVEEQAR